MLAEIDIFSGRPNPRWPLSETETVQVTRLMESLDPPTGAHAPDPPGLGYRGFRLRDSSGSTWTAYGGFVHSANRLLADPKRSVERFLLHHLPPEYDEFRSLESELGPG
jgi:hypothetical protein